MLKNIVIIGAGGSRTSKIALIIEDINEVNKEWNLLGFVDDGKEVDEIINGYRMIR